LKDFKRLLFNCVLAVFVTYTKQSNKQSNPSNVCLSQEIARLIPKYINQKLKANISREIRKINIASIKKSSSITYISIIRKYLNIDIILSTKQIIVLKTECFITLLFRLHLETWFDYLTENKVIVTDARGSIRVSFAMFNSHDEVDQLAHIIKKD
jgi:selenocysteine lyase/cysteine desulfurase